MRPDASENSQISSSTIGLPELLLAIHTSRQSCCKGRKARIFTPVRESSGESWCKSSVSFCEDTACERKSNRTFCPAPSPKEAQRPCTPLHRATRLEG